jgi:predicted hydrocarbon binding protein
MRAADLALDELLEFQRDGGILRFAGQRATLVDTLALGLLRKELVDTFGLHAARGLMTRVGYQHGWRTAETLERALPWASVDEWRRAGTCLHRLQGMASFEPVDERERDDPTAFAEAIWRDSYEVEQHLLHFGQADDPVCWSLSGFASGYLSRAYGRTVVCVEVQCRGRGDPLCRMRGDQREPLRFEPRPQQLRDRNVDVSLAAIEREHILAVLDDSGGNKAEAARRLGIGTATLFRKLKRYREWGELGA